MSTLWNDIATKCKPVALSAPFNNVYVTADLGNPWHWAIGKYRDLRRLGKQLRTNKQLCDELWDAGVRFGFRTSGKNPTDVPPLGLKRQKGYEEMVEREVTGSFKRTTPVLPAVKSNLPAPNCRLGDQFSNVETYWASQTPQAHHIVEFSNLDSFDLSARYGAADLDYYGLPCVLLMAEFHQRYISSVLKHTHGFDGKTLPPNDKVKELQKLEGIYKALYDQSAYGKNEVFPFRSLWEISELVFAAAKSKAKTTFAK